MPFPSCRSSPSARSGAPLSFAQERLWFFDRLTPGSIVYNMPLALSLAGLLQPDALAAALGEIVRRHDALRTVFTAGPPDSDLDPEQIVRPFAGLALPRVDLSGLPAPQAKAEAGRIEWEEGRRPFDLEAGPLLRPFLLRLAGDSHTLLLPVHHIVADGWSLGVLCHELAVHYRAAASGETLSPLPPLPVQVPDFAVWQRRWLQGEVLETLLAAWRQHLAGHPGTLDLPTDRLRPAEQTFGGATVPLPLTAGQGRELLEGLRRLGRRQGATPFMIALAAFQALLQRYNRAGRPGGGHAHRPAHPLGAGRADRLLRQHPSGAYRPGRAAPPSSPGRPGARSHLVGLRPSGFGRSRSWWKRWHRTAACRAIPWCRRPWPSRTRRRRSTSWRRGSSPAWSASPRGSRASISPPFWRRGDGLAGVIEYATDLFDEVTIRRLAEHFLNLLRSALAAPDAALPELSLLSPGGGAAERRSLERLRRRAEGDRLRARGGGGLFRGAAHAVWRRSWAGAWSDVLGCGRVGRRDNFFPPGRPLAAGEPRPFPAARAPRRPTSAT